MFRIEDKVFNPALVAWVGDVKEVKRFKPKAEKGGDGELPPVYNFMFKSGFDTYKSNDYESHDQCYVVWELVVNAVDGVNKRSVVNNG